MIITLLVNNTHYTVVASPGGHRWQPQVPTMPRVQVYATPLRSNAVTSSSVSCCAPSLPGSA
jgi:hypothetical protein